MARPIDKELLDPGIVRHAFTRSQALALGEAWLAAFAANGFGQASRQYLWHVFAAGRTPALEGPPAREAYAAHASEHYIVLDNDRRAAYRTATRPIFKRHTDWLVFPENLAWSMAFTHEEGWMGPTFARHPDYARLDAANQARLKKLQDIAQARERGWTPE